MSNKYLNWAAYWRIMSRFNQSPLSQVCPPIKVEEMDNWERCQDEMGFKFYQKETLN